MTNKLLMLLSVLTILLAGAIFSVGYSLGSANNSSESSQKTSEETEEPAMNHMHPKYDFPKGKSAPELVEVIAKKDPKSGWNIELVTKNFAFAPKSVNSNNVDGQGHAHIYVDGQKLGRLYSKHYHLNSYNTGVHKLKVTLNTNDHKDIYVDGMLVAAETKLVGDHEHDGTEGESHEH